MDFNPASQPLPGAYPAVRTVYLTPFDDAANVFPKSANIAQVSAEGL